MLFEILHTTEYTYSEKVFFEPHFLRFKPKITPHSIVKDFTISILPEPSGLSEQIDIENNFNILCWFDDPHQNLRISAQSLVEVKEYNPFNFLVHPPEYLRIPFAYSDKLKLLLIPSLQAEDLSQAIIEFSNTILKVSKYQSIVFLSQLTSEIHNVFSLEIRETGNPNQPDVTFKEKKGSCRDLAWMQIHLLRQLGIATRFVSGYYYLNVENPEFELHAWLEAYLPGAGWVGLDPSHGILTSNNHIPVASSGFYEHTMPVSGTVRGSADSKMKNELNISIVP